MTSLLVQVGPITLKCLFNAIGTIINPHLELTLSSSHQDPSPCNMILKIGDMLGRPMSTPTYSPLSLDLHSPSITPSCLTPYLTYTHKTAIHIHLPTLSPTLSPSHSLTTYKLVKLPHYKVRGPICLHPHTTNHHHTYYTHTLRPSSGLYTHQCNTQLLSSYPPRFKETHIHLITLLEPTHVVTWYRD